MLDKPPVVIIDEETLAGGVTVPTSPIGSECDIIDLTKACQLALTLEGSCVATADGALVAHLRTSPSGGTTDVDEWDSVDYHGFTLPCVASQHIQMTQPIWPDPLYMKVMVENSGTEVVNDVKVSYAIQEIEAV
ncbi:unnamed protein product [marine sediment metagenome]|uniref:Uncharacterized protein n=1 Tax=marine sediment metagenome TaxID=412755 RepID=X1HKS9_9ZZZZ